MASAIRRTALLTVEGVRHDICAIGQTMAAYERRDVRLSGATARDA